MRRWSIIPVILFVAGCGREAAVPPRPVEPHLYLLLVPATQAQGWAAIEAVRARLPAADAARIRTAGLVDSRRAEMYIDAGGDCARDARFVAAASRIAAAAGVAKVTCSATLPGSL